MNSKTKNTVENLILLSELYQTESATDDNIGGAVLCSKFFHSLIVGDDRYDFG